MVQDSLDLSTQCILAGYCRIPHSEVYLL